VRFDATPISRPEDAQRRLRRRGWPTSAACIPTLLQGENPMPQRRAYCPRETPAVRWCTLRHACPIPSQGCARPVGSLPLAWRMARPLLLVLHVTPKPSCDCAAPATREAGQETSCLLVPSGAGPAGRCPWQRAPLDPGRDSARYRCVGLTSRIDEILLSLMPWSFTFR
jgi:hypothetical protein